MKKYFNNNKTKLVNLINLDKHNTNYLIPIYPILLFDKSKYKLINLINLDKHNTNYLIPISLILFYEKIF